MVTAVIAAGAPPETGLADCAGRRAAAGICRRLVVEDDGQELIEYGLLTLLVMAVGFALFIAIQAGMGTAYRTWAAAILDNWQPSPPAAP